MVRVQWPQCGSCVNSEEQWVDDGHALVLEGFLYGTEISFTCSEHVCLPRPFVSLMKCQINGCLQVFGY